MQNNIKKDLILFKDLVEDLLKEDLITLVIQVYGRVRDTMDQERVLISELRGVLERKFN